MKFIKPPLLFNFGGAAHAITVQFSILKLYVCIYEQRILKFEGQTFTDLSSTLSTTHTFPSLV